jgi:Leucine-rich repeat (LRR) protein
MDVERERQLILQDTSLQQSSQVKFDQWIRDLLVKRGAIRELEWTDSSGELVGSLDLSTIHRQGLTHVESLIFPPGRITELTHIPKTLQILSCPNNLLMHIDDMPASLQELNIDGNACNELDLSTVPKLRKLSANRNRLLTLNHIPASIEELYLDHNQLSYVDLEGLDTLRVLHISHNRLMVIDHFPGGVRDFVMEHNPMAAIMRNKEDKKSGASGTKTTVDYLAALDVYMKLKTKYEVSLRKLDKPVSSRRRGSVKKRAPCVNCKRPVGTIFRKTGRTYVAICGDKAAPCALHIELESGQIYDTIHDQQMAVNEWQESKQRMMRHKTDTLFRYISDTDSVEKFKTLLQEYTDSNEYMQILTDKHTSLYANPLRNELIQRKLDAVYDTMKTIRQMLEEYQKSPENRGALRTAVQMMHEEVTPAWRSLRQIKYDITEMDTVETAQGKFKENVLVQYPNHPMKSQMISPDVNPARVVHFQGIVAK